MPSAATKIFNFSISICRIYWLALAIGSPAHGAEFLYVPTALETLVEQNPVRSYLSDSNGDTWIGTQSGLFRLNDIQGKRLNSVASGMQRLLSDEIVSLIEGPFGQVLALSENGQSYIYSETDDDFKRLGSSSNDISHDGRQLLFNSQNVLAVRLEKTLDFYFHPSLTNAAAIKPTTIKTDITTKLINADDLGFCGGTNRVVTCGLARPLAKQMTVFRAPPGAEILDIAYINSTRELCVLLDDYEIRVFNTSGLGKTRQIEVPELAGSQLRTMEYSAGKLFFATDRGLFYGHINATKMERLESNKYVAITGISFLSHGLWVLSENGMAYLAASRGNSWQGESIGESLEILGFAKNKQDGVFIATYDGIIYWNRATDTHTRAWPTVDDKSLDTRITSLLVREDQLYAGTFTDGFRIFTIAPDGRVFPQSGHYLGTSGITAMMPMMEGLLIGTDDQGLKYFQNQRITDVQMPLEWHRNRSPITSMAALPKTDKLLVTTEDHVILVCKNDSMPYSCGMQSAKTGAIKSRIISSTLDPDGSIWLGTLNHGLLRSSLSNLQQNKPLHQGSLYGTSALSIYSVILDDSDTLWASTNNGLLEINAQTGNARRLGRIHGLTNIDFNHGAGLKVGHEYFFGGHFGYDKVNQESSLNLDSPTHIWMRGITVDGMFNRLSNTRTSSPDLSVDPDVKIVDFHVTVNDYRLPSLHQYQHILEGFDLEWQDTGNVNVVSYQNLPPGRYTFKARGANSTGVWSDNEVILAIEVLPPIWRSWWAQLSYLVLALAAFLYLKRLNDQYVAHKERLKLAEEGSAAFARLEDDYQAQREANEVLLSRRTPSANTLLDVVETALSAQLENADSRDIASALIIKLKTLHSLQALTDRTTSEERTNLHALTDEIASNLAESSEFAARAIISNNVSDDPVLLEHAVYVCLVIQETLELAITGRQFESTLDPIIYISMDSPTLTETGEYCYALKVEDSGQKDNNASALERLLPLTFHLIETGGGTLCEAYDAGNAIFIELLFPAISTSAAL